MENIAELEVDSFEKTVNSILLVYICSNSLFSYFGNGGGNH